jgi:hypothetical protein
MGRWADGPMGDSEIAINIPRSKADGMIDQIVVVFCEQEKIVRARESICNARTPFRCAFGSSVQISKGRVDPNGIDAPGAISPNFQRMGRATSTP